MRIGISTRSLVVNDKESFVVYKRYLEYFKDVEFVMLLPNQSVDVLELCDGFILTGGDDLNPNLYNEVNTNSNDVDDETDELDMLIIDYAYKRNKPLLGICRGIQSINVYFNGSLIQDYSNHMKVNHYINMKNKPRLVDLGDCLEVNSYHHQIIGRLGNDLIATYECNGVVEVIEHINKKIIGVQFHPEFLNNKSYDKIFDIYLGLF